jgi:Beta-xylosidase
MQKFIKILVSLILFGFFTTLLTVSAQGNLKLHYSFASLTSDSSQIKDDSGTGYNAWLHNGAKVRKIGSQQVVDLGTSNGYLELKTVGSLIAALQDFTISVSIYIDHSVSVSDNGNFIWAFGNSGNMAADQNGCMFLSAKSLRYAVSLTNWSGEQSVDFNMVCPRGVWKHIAYVQSGTTGSIYIDGVLVKSATVSIKPGQLGATQYNYIGRSSYLGDAFLKKSCLADFRIYDKALSLAEIKTLAENIGDLNHSLTAQQLIDAAKGLSLEGLERVNSNLTFPAKTNDGISISWVSANPEVVSNTGMVTRPAIGQGPVSVNLVATLSKNGQTQTKTFSATILPVFNDITSVTRDSASLSITGNLNNLHSGLALPDKGVEGSTITWKSDKKDYITSSGKLIKLAAKGNGKLPVKLTATIAKGKVSTQKVFQIYVAEDEGYSSYLFAYFTGNDISQESIRFALSSDGFTYKALNDNHSILNSADISSTGGVRDPHIYRGPDGNFYMVATDMVSAHGWDSNRAMVLLKSPDLINWKSSIVNIQTKYGYADLLRVWAPQTIYNEKAGKFMIYYSLKRGNNPDIIYYSYANASFTDIEGEPKQLFYSPTNNACIDADIIPRNGEFNLFFKTEGNGNGIKKAVSRNLTEGYVLQDQYLQQTTSPVEGACVFKLINSDDYILMYDMYTSGRYQFTKSSDLTNFKAIDNEISMDFTPRHGTVMPITAAEARALVSKWGTPNDLVILGADGPQVKKHNVVIDNTKNMLYVPVCKGPDLTSLDLGLKTVPGVTVNPTGKADFSKGDVSYTLSFNGIGTRTYTVKVSEDHNPVLEGYYADPEILYSNKTGKFYLYPTSDGFTGWSGTYFKTFSSDNLVDWKDEGVILNLPSDVSWGTSSAWAPTIIERKINGQYKYFYYFCASQKIGVTVSDNPTGPFTDSGSPLVSSLPAGVNGGQQIDPDVFHDPVSNKYYLYWGNGYMACAQLNDDMVSVNMASVKVLTPNASFREGTEVAYRNGKYYFFWSEDDTRSPNYQVRYATASSPEGPLTIPANNLVISKDADQGIYGTGHNCVLQIPGKDEWYIIYHRFTRPKGITMGDAAGYNREVCIDKLEFNADGSIRQVKPTLKGIQPVTLPSKDTKGKHSTTSTFYPRPSEMNCKNVKS